MFLVKQRHKFQLKCYKIHARYLSSRLFHLVTTIYLTLLFILLLLALGLGCLLCGYLISLLLQNMSVIGFDIDPESLETATLNAEELEVFFEMK
jgi:predicted RNA methylase